MYLYRGTAKYKLLLLVTSMLRCSSCQKEVTDDYVRFKCPKCGKEEVVRCMKCRGTVAKYKCGSCGFEGP